MKGGRAGGGGARPEGTGSNATSSAATAAAAPGHPLPESLSAAARRLLSAQLAPRLPGSCARAQKGWGRLESRHRVGWGQSSHVGCCRRWRDPSVLSTAQTGRSVPSRVTMKTSLSVCSQLRFAWPGMARGKIWPGDLDSVTLKARPGVNGLGGFPPSNHQNHSFCVHPHL